MHATFSSRRKNVLEKDTKIEIKMKILYILVGDDTNSRVTNPRITNQTTWYDHMIHMHLSHEDIRWSWRFFLMPMISASRLCFLKYG
jgi:hypothetical protein